MSRVHYAGLLPPAGHPRLPAQLELMHTVVQTQEAAIVHALIELCVPPLVPEVAASACRFIHCMFVADPALVRLVHVQGYTPAALPALVAGVPSMHVCLDLLQDLLAAATPQQQAFAVLLAGALARAYPVPAALVAARACVGRLHAACYLDPESRDTLLTLALPALPQLCAAFPPLAAAGAALLGRLRAGELARAAVQRGGPTGLLAVVDTVFGQLVDSAIVPNSLNV